LIGNANISYFPATTNILPASEPSGNQQFYCSSVLAWGSESGQIGALGVQLSSTMNISVDARIMAYSMRYFLNPL
jgi:hypothetical protein